MARFVTVLSPKLRLGMPEERPQVWCGLVEDHDESDVLIKNARRLIRLNEDGNLLRLEFDKVIGDLKLYNFMKIDYYSDDKDVGRIYKHDIVKLVLEILPSPEIIDYMKEAVRKWG